MAEEFPFSGPGTQQNTPIGRLVSRWRVTTFLPGKEQALRAELYEACLAEIRELNADNIHYDPARDHRVTWCSQYLQVLGGKLRRIDPGMAAVIDFLFGEVPAAPSFQHRAANDTP